MVVQPIQINQNKSTQPSLKQNKAVKPYLEASGKILTENNVKPLPGQGHLVHDNLVSSINYSLKDIAYDLKSIKDGYQGKANDHQSGRLNDVGLVLGGLGIATYLASQTSNPKARLMEFVGLGAFLASMKIFPKIAINKPARIMHGFDIDKQYIDDQGRKKSVFQDSNYIPFDLYRGEHKSEDLDVIADRMGIPADTPNRHEIVKEQMRKIATQNNTLWMLTAGFATPAMAGLTCCALEQPISNGIANYRNAKYNNLIEEIATTTKNMEADLKTLKDNELSKEVTKILQKYKKDGILPKEEFDNITSLITKNLDSHTRNNLVDELKTVFETSAGQGENFFLVNDDILESIIKNAKQDVKARKSKLDIITPTVDEFKTAIKEVITDADFSKDVKVKSSNVSEIKAALEKIINDKINKAGTSGNTILKDLKTTLLSNISKNLRKEKALSVNDSIINKVEQLTKIIGDYKINQSVIEECKHFKFAHAPETIIANYSGKFERALLNELNFTQDELKKIRDSADFAKEILDKRLTEIANDEIRYTRIVKKLTTVISDMEYALHGSEVEAESVIRKLISAIESNANTTAKRLGNLGGFKETIKALVNDNVDDLENRFDGEKSFKDFLEGTVRDYRNGNHQKEISGVGSIKHKNLSNIFERYQGSRNSFFRVLEALDVYKRATSPSTYAPEMALRGNGEKYVEDLIRIGQDTILNANCAAHMRKLDTTNNGEFYKDIMKSLFRVNYPATSDIPNGVLAQATEDAVGENAKLKSVLEQLKRYIGRLYDIVPNNTNDTMKEKTHFIDLNAPYKYDKAFRTNRSFFDLVAQEPSEIIRGAADRRYGTRKWLGIIGGITASVFAITYLAQLGFGKLNRPIKDESKVNNDSNK